MNLDSTAKISFHDHSINWSQVKAHINRQHEKYSNEHINLAKSGQNYSGMIHDIKTEARRKFALYVQLYNLWEISHGHKNRVYKNVHDYFKRSGIQPERNIVIQIGNKKVRPKYYNYLHKQGLKNSQIRELENEALFKTAHEAEAKSKLHLGCMTSNLDETSAHLHCQAGSFPTAREAKRVAKNDPKLSDKQKKNFINYFMHPVNLTPRGKKWKRKLAHILTDDFELDPKTAHYFAHRTIINRPSASFNAELCLMHPEAVNAKGQPDSRKAMSIANRNLSKMAINNFNKVMARHSLNLHLNFVRTHKATNLSNAAYEAHEEAKKQSNIILSKASKHINTEIKSANNDLANDTNSFHAYANSATSSISSASNSVTKASNSINSATESMSKAMQSMNNSMASASKSVAKSIKNKKSSMASSFDSSAYGGYAKALSSGLTQYLPKSKRSSFNWLKLAKGSEATAGNETISNPLAFYASYQVSRASSASSAYNSTKNSNQSLKAENSSLTSKNKKLKKVNKSVINLRNNLANDFRTEEDQPHLNHMSNHRVFKTLIFWEKQGVRRISKLVWKAKRKAKRIIKNAKIKAEDLVKPNKDGERAMRDFIWQHEDCYPNIYKKTPDKLNGDQLMQSFNDTAHNYHEFDSPEAQRKDKEIQNEANDHGITWTP